MPDIHVYMLDIWLMYIEEARRSCILFVNLDGLRFQRRWLPLMLTDYSIQSFLHGLCMLSADGAWSRQSSIVSEGARTIHCVRRSQNSCLRTKHSTGVCLPLYGSHACLIVWLPTFLSAYLSEWDRFSLCISVYLCQSVCLSLPIWLSVHIHTYTVHIQLCERRIALVAAVPDT